MAAGDSALRLGVGADELAVVVARTARARGVLRARAALPMLDARSRSRPETHLRLAVAMPDLPAFAVNEAVYRASGGWLGEPDLALVEAKIALEYQGKDHADEERMRKDMTRAKDFRSEGWAIFFYGPAEVFKRPWELRGEVRQAIRQRGPHLFASRRMSGGLG